MHFILWAHLLLGLPQGVRSVKATSQMPGAVWMVGFRCWGPRQIPVLPVQALIVLELSGAGCLEPAVSSLALGSQGQVSLLCMDCGCRQLHVRPLFTEQSKMLLAEAGSALALSPSPLLCGLTSPRQGCHVPQRRAGDWREAVCQMAPS